MTYGGCESAGETTGWTSRRCSQEDKEPQAWNSGDSACPKAEPSSAHPIVLDKNSGRFLVYLSSSPPSLPGAISQSQHPSLGPGPPSATLHGLARVEKVVRRFSDSLKGSMPKKNMGAT